MTILTDDNPKIDSEKARLVARVSHQFLAHGFRSVTMADLSTELGMSKKTFYTHFASKLDLLNAVVEAKMERMSVAMEEALQGAGGSFEDRLLRILSVLRREMEEIQPGFVRDMRRDLPELFERVQVGRRKMIYRDFGRLLEEGAAAGKIRVDIPVRFLIEVLVGAVDAVIVPERMEELGLSPQRGFAQIISVFLEGALVRKGGES